MKPIILIIEDEFAIRGMLRFALENANFTVQEAEDAKQAETLIKTQLPSLILLDWMLPHLSGLEFAQQLKQGINTQDIPIIMLTAKADESSKVECLETGADDYIVKPFSPRELIARIKAVLRRGGGTENKQAIKFRDLVIDAASYRVTIDSQPLKLNPLEYRLLHFLVSHQDRVYTRDQLLTHVWGGDSFIDERTVDVHIRRLRKCLTPSGYAQYIRTVHGVGYQFSLHSNE